MAQEASLKCWPKKSSLGAGHVNVEVCVTYSCLIDLAQHRTTYVYAHKKAKSWHTPTHTAPHDAAATSPSRSWSLLMNSTSNGLTSSGASSCGQCPTPGSGLTSTTDGKRSSARTRPLGVQGSSSPQQTHTGALSLGSERSD